MQSLFDAHAGVQFKEVLEVVRHSKPAPNIIEKTVSAGAEVAEGISGVLSDIIKIGPGFDAQEEEFYREMQCRKKKRKGLRL